MKNTDPDRPKVFLDTNILIDYVLFRGEEALASEYIFESHMDSGISLYVAAHSLTNLYYSIRKDMSEAERNQIILNLCTILNVVPVSGDNIEKAILAGYSRDVEDALQIQCAIESKCDYFVTRDRELFEKSPVTTLLPDELIHELGFRKS